MTTHNLSSTILATCLDHAHRDRKARLQTSATYAEKISRRGSLQGIKEIGDCLASMVDIKYYNHPVHLRAEATLNIDAQDFVDRLDNLIWSSAAITANTYKKQDDKVSYFKSRFHVINSFKEKVIPKIIGVLDRGHLCVDDWMKYSKKNVCTKEIRTALLAKVADFIDIKLTDHVNHGRNCALIQIGHIIESHGNVAIWDKFIDIDDHNSKKLLDSDSIASAVYLLFTKDEIFKGFGEMCSADLDYMEGRRNMLMEFNSTLLPNVIESTAAKSIPA